MSFGEFLAQILGWLGEFIAWIFNWVPRRILIDCNQAGVRYYMGQTPDAVMPPGAHWYIPNYGRVVTHWTNEYVLDIQPMALETKDGISVSIGCAITGRIVDVIAYEVNNFSADENSAQRAKAGLREIVNEHTWAELCKPCAEGTRLEQKLSRRMTDALVNFGIEVEQCSPTDQVRLGRGATRLFGVGTITDTNKL